MSLKWTPPRLPTKKIAVHENTDPYAAAVHEGARLKIGGTIQARPWMMSAYQGPYGGYDAIGQFMSAYRQSSSISKAFRSTASRANNIMRQLIKFNGWPYNATTKRKNGQIVGPPTRNIFDKGGLARAQQPVRYE